MLKKMWKTEMMKYGVHQAQWATNRAGCSAGYEAQKVPVHQEIKRNHRSKTQVRAQGIRRMTAACLVIGLA